MAEEPPFALSLRIARVSLDQRNESSVAANPAEPSEVVLVTD
jgi:hypothetical protein